MPKNIQINQSMHWRSMIYIRIYIYIVSWARRAFCNTYLLSLRTVVCEVLENKSRTIELLNEFRARGFIGVGVKKSVGSFGGVKTSFSSIKK